MPFDGKSGPGFMHETPMPGIPGPESHGTPLFGTGGSEWPGFFLALTGVFGLVLGLAAVLMALGGR